MVVEVSLISFFARVQAHHLVALEQFFNSRLLIAGDGIWVWGGVNPVFRI